MVNLKLEDINFSEEIISVLGKGKKMRIVPLEIKLFNLYRNGLKVRAQLKNINDTSILFLTNKAKSLTQRASSVSFEILGKKTGAL